MTKVTKNILIVFSDSSLGGTSRSALISGHAWTHAGYQVAFLPFIPIAPARLSLFEYSGTVLDPEQDVRLSDFNLIHLHHPAWSARSEKSARKLIELAHEQEHVPPLLSNNVFGVRDKILQNWPAVRAVGVLGTWSALQYRYSMGLLRGRKWPWIIPNPQDTEFFRPPTEWERRDARERWGLAQEQICILRIGSPNGSKWSKAYVDLTDQAETRNYAVILVGCPPELHAQITSATVRYPAMTADDRELRSLYWAADVFALNAARGESFGNVILEALACGTPVVYRSRTFRDNTPWEFQSLPGFYYVGSDEDWVRTSLGNDLWGDQSSRGTAHQMVREKYSVSSVGGLYVQLIERLAHASHRSTFDSQKPPKVPGLRQLTALAMANNPLIAILKEQRLKGRR